MLLHSAEKEIDDKTVTAVLTAAGVDADKARVKALVQSLSSVDIGDAMATAAAAPAAGGGAAAPAAAEEAPAAEEEEEEDDGGGFGGLGDLFG